MKITLFGVCLIGLSGCVSQDTMLRNNAGQFTHCAGWGFGIIGVPVALAEHDNCMKKARAAGFVEASNPLPAAAEPAAK